jgi:hypothetical protein
MPRIDLVSPVYYDPNDPYYYLYDNLPLRNIITRQGLINLALDNVIEQMTDAVGTQNTVANRLNQSINPDGSLEKAAIDEALHTMDAHTDTVNYVRMQASESTKLGLIADGATNFGLNVQTDDASPPTLVNFQSGVLELDWSESVTLSLSSPNKLQMHMTFPVAAAHQHFYDQTPVPANSLTPDYINYQVNSVSSAIMVGSLRVYVNGIRLSSSAPVYAPGSNVDIDPWTLLQVTPNEASGLFSLSTNLSTTDVIRIDYDTSYI